MSIIIACITLCGACSMTSNSRMYYAFSRVSPEMPSIRPPVWPAIRRAQSGVHLIRYCLDCHRGETALTGTLSHLQDSGIPKWFDYVDPRTQSPLRTVWLAVVLSFILCLPALGSTVAYVAVTSIATIGLYISYVIPIAVGVAFDQERFKAVRGPFHLGKFSRPCAIIATGYVAFITVVFCLPTVTPGTSKSLGKLDIAQRSV